MSLLSAFLYLLPNSYTFTICKKMPHSDTLFPFPPLFVILSQIPKQTFELDNLFCIPHLWYFSVHIVDNFVYNFVSHGFRPFLLGITFRFFHKMCFQLFLYAFLIKRFFVQFAQKRTCQYHFEFFLFSLFSKYFTKETDRVPDTVMSETHILPR